MPINQNTVKAYTDLGITGAALLILLIFVVLLFTLFRYSSKQTEKIVTKFNTVESTNQTAAIEKLVTKIDQLITSNYEYTSKLNEVLLTNDKDQQAVINLLNTVLEYTLDTQKRVVRIDDRTFRCLGSINQDKKEETA